MVKILKYVDHFSVGMFKTVLTFDLIFSLAEINFWDTNRSENKFIVIGVFKKVNFKLY